MRISDWSSDVCSSDLPPSAGSCAAAFDAALLAAPLAPVACAHAVLPSITASTKLTDATALSHCLIENSPRVLQVPTVRQGFVPPTGSAARSVPTRREPSKIGRAAGRERRWQDG